MSKCGYTHHEYIIVAAASAVHLAQTAADIQQSAANANIGCFLIQGEKSAFFLEV